MWESLRSVVCESFNGYVDVYFVCVTSMRTYGSYGTIHYSKHYTFFKKWLLVRFCGGMLRHSSVPKMTLQSAFFEKNIADRFKSVGLTHFLHIIFKLGKSITLYGTNNRQDKIFFA